MAELGVKIYDPEKPRRKRNLSEARWTVLKPLIKQCYERQYIRSEILAALEREHGTDGDILPK